MSEPITPEAQQAYEDAAQEMARIDAKRDVKKLAYTWQRFVNHAAECSVLWECPEGWELYNSAVAANEEALR